VPGTVPTVLREENFLLIIAHNSLIIAHNSAALAIPTRGRQEPTNSASHGHCRADLKQTSSSSKSRTIEYPHIGT
jgi:hypothetical protein